MKTIIDRIEQIGIELNNKFGSEGYTVRCKLYDLRKELEAINYTRCCKELKAKHAQALFEYKQQLKETDNNDTMFIDNKEEWIRQTSILEGKITILEDI